MRTLTLRRLALAPLLLLAACTPPTSPAADASTDAPIATDVPVAPSDAAVTDASGSHTSRLQFPPTAIAPAQETTLCVQLALDNATPQLVRHGHVSLAPGSHHVIAYRMPANAETWTAPRPCTAFSGVADSAPAMIMAQAAESDLVMPDNVGAEIGAHQVVRLEQHFINTTTATLQGTSTLTLETSDPSDSIVRANMFFWGPLGIQVAPHSTGSADFFHVVQPGVQIFALSTHQHHYGTLATVSQAANAASAGTELYRNTNWAEPPLRAFTPPVAFDGSQGVHLHCEWFNTTDGTLHWGESAATDEMCFVGGYYYPSHGFEYCIDSSCSSL